VDGAGDVFYASGGAITELMMSTPPSFSFPDTHVGFSSASQSGTIANVGTAPLTFSLPGTGFNPSVGADFTPGGTCPIVAAGASALNLNAGVACSFTVAFAPMAGDSYSSVRSSDIVATDNNLNAPSVTQSIPLSGNALAPPESTSTSITFTPGALMDAGQTVTISGTVSGTVTPIGMVSITDTYDSVTTTLSSCVTLTSGAYTFNYVNVQGTGTHVITVTYLPGGNNESYVTSYNTANLTVQPAGTTTTTLVVARAISSTIPRTWVPTGTPITLTATVVAGSTPLTPGVVKFCDSTSSCTDTRLLGSAQLTSPSGTATLTFIPGKGEHHFIAVFVADTVSSTNYLASTSSWHHLWVGGPPPNQPPYSTTTTFTSTGTNPYALTATVVGMGSMTRPVTGMVSFQDSSNSDWQIGTATLGASTRALDFENPATGDYTNPTGGNSAVAVGDFNGDGILDMALTNSNTATLSIYLGTGSGLFTAGPTYTIGHGAQSIVVGDFNNDGKLDLATANLLDNTVTVLLGCGDGTFYVSSSPATGSAPTAIVTGDFNGDGNADLAVANSVSNTVTILLGNGLGAFTAGTTPSTGNHPVSLAVGDFDNNGHLDLRCFSETAPAPLLPTFVGTPATAQPPSQLRTSATTAPSISSLPTASTTR
jgi:FG-GAP-like repeat/Bacterial Ig-like domain (group 3)